MTALANHLLNTAWWLLDNLALIFGVALIVDLLAWGVVGYVIWTRKKERA